MRVCMRFGCGTQLAPNQLFNFCNVCLRLGFGRGAPAPPTAPKCLPKRVRKDEIPSGVLISKVEVKWFFIFFGLMQLKDSNSKRDIDTAQTAEALVQPPQETFAELDTRNNDDEDLELMYPEVSEMRPFFQHHCV